MMTTPTTDLPAKRPTLRELLLVLLANTLIAYVLWLAGMNDRFIDIWVVSQCIGFGICFTQIGLCWLYKTSHPSAAMSTVGIVLGGLLGIGVAFLGGVFSHSVQSTWFHFSRLSVLALIFGTLVTVVFHYAYRLKSLRLAQQDAEIRELAQQKQSAIAHLKLLQAQIEPHFLFNTLANLHSLIGHNDALARTLLERLNEYLRASLDHSRSDQGTVADECRMLTAYLEIQAVRMGDRLDWIIDVAPELMCLPFPPMLLQPLVENAIRHGIEPRVGKGKIVLQIHRSGHGVCCEVQDDGIGLRDQYGGHGIGLRNIRERLGAIYGGAASFVLQENQPSGVIARLWIPLDAPAP